MGNIFSNDSKSTIPDDINRLADQLEQMKKEYDLFSEKYVTIDKFNDVQNRLIESTAKLDILTANYAAISVDQQYLKEVKHKCTKASEEHSDFIILSSQIQSEYMQTQTQLINHSLSQDVVVGSYAVVGIGLLLSLVFTYKWWRKAKSIRLP